LGRFLSPAYNNLSSSSKKSFGIIIGGLPPLEGGVGLPIFGGRFGFGTGLE
jgi:hypothetical protein